MKQPGVGAALLDGGCKGLDKLFALPRVEGGDRFVERQGLRRCCHRAGIAEPAMRRSNFPSVPDAFKESARL